MQTTSTRPLYEIASTIYADMRAQYPAKSPSWWAYAKPYVEALSGLTSINDSYGYDSGKSIVLYTLSNLQYWRGDTARAVKAELKAIAGVK